VGLTAPVHPVDDRYLQLQFVPGARRAVAGDGDHSVAPSDPLFHAHLARFLTGD
jgi:hypothetical protein